MLRGTLIAAIALALGLSAAPAGAVVNGDEAASSDYPFAVAILDAQRILAEGAYQAQFCGGALTTSRTVVTAAHCVVDQKSGSLADPDELVVAIGHALKSPDLRIVRVSAVAVHPSYRKDTAENDVAVLTLEEAVTDVPLITPMRPTDLRSYVEQGSRVRVVGWGNQATSGNSFPDHLRVGRIVIFPDSACGSNVPYVLKGIEFDGFDADEANPEVLVCAAGVTGAGKVIDACQGDSGSPLVGGDGAAERLVGVVSWGEDCATRHPGVYTRLSAMADFLVSQNAIATLAPTVAPTLTVEEANEALRVTFTPAADGSSTSAFAATAVDASGMTQSCFTRPRRDRLPAMCTITGLVNGTAYSVSGIAANVLGDSPAAAPIGATPKPVPSAGAITRVRAFAGGFAAFSVAPTVPNGSPITSLRVVCLPLRGGPGVSARVVDGRALLDGLDEGRYRCSTAARNAIGTATSNPRLVIGRG